MATQRFNGDKKVGKSILTKAEDAHCSRTRYVISALTCVIVLGWVSIWVAMDLTRSFGARLDTFPDSVIFPLQTVLALLTIYPNFKALKTCDKKFIKLSYLFSTLAISFMIATMFNFSVFWGYWFS